MAATILQLEPPTLTIPMTRTAPTIDGHIEAAEWSDATQITGFIGMADKEYFHRQGRVWLSWTPEALYMAYRSAFPAGRQEGGAWDEKALRAFVHERDGRVFADDSVELYLAPVRPTQYIQFIGNSLGAIMDRRFGEVDWRGDWQFKNRVDNGAGIWELELGITFASLGVNPPRDGDRWFINVARTWRGMERAFTSITGDYRRGMAKALFAGRGPVVRELSWGRPLAGMIEPNITVTRTTGKARNLQCTYAVLGSDAQPVTDTEHVAEGRVHSEAVFQLKASTVIGTPGKYAVKAAVTDKTTGHVLYERLLPFGIYRPIGLEPFYVLKTGQLGVLADFTRLPVSPVDDKAKAVFRTFSGGREIAREVMDPISTVSCPVYFRTGDLVPAGDLEITCSLTCGTQTWEERVAYRIPRKPEWYGRYDVDDSMVPFPWVSLQVEAGPVVSCWNRRYVFGNTPLPEQIYVGKKKLLASPVILTVASPTDSITWESGPVHIEHRSPAKVILTKRGRVGDLTVAVKTVIEYDGFLWTTVILEPGNPVGLDTVRVEFSLRPENAAFFHVNGEWGEKLFGALEHRDEFTVLDDERNYYWIGDDEVGLCWLTDNFAGWQPAGKDRRIGLEKRDGRWIGFLSPWRESGTLEQDLSWNFGLQATPTRPPHRRPVRALLCYNTPPTRLGYPVAKYGDTVVEMSLKGKMNYPPFPGDAVRIRKWISGYEKRGMKFVIYQYIDGGTETDAYEDYWGDWVTCMPPDRTQWRTVTAKCCLESSWSDYYCHILETMMRDYGVHGIYLDGVMARPCQRGKSHGGSCTQERWPILVAREHFKKVLEVARRYKGPESILFAHVSLGTIAPLTGLMDVHLKGENYGAPLSYDDLTPAVLRAEFGKQWGPQSIILPQLTKKQAIPIGRFLGMIALHGIDTAPSFLPPKERTQLLLPLWEILDEQEGKDAEFRPYFRQDTFVELSGKPVSFYLDRKTRECIVVIANQTPDSVAFTVQFAPENTGLPERMASIRDCFSKMTLPTSGKQFTIGLDAWEFRLLRVAF